MFHRLVCAVVVCGLGLGLAGCSDSGPDLVRAKGTVTYNGKPVAGATVTFKPASGPLATGVTDASGVFTLTTGGRPGAVLGPHKVGITKMTQAKEADEEMTPEQYEEAMSKGAGGGSVDSIVGEAKSEIPEKYADPETSGLTATIDSDASKNEFEFPLVD